MSHARGRRAAGLRLARAQEALAWPVAGLYQKYVLCWDKTFLFESQPLADEGTQSCLAGKMACIFPTYQRTKELKQRLIKRLIRSTTN